jgi:hypothetical protein
MMPSRFLRSLIHPSNTLEPVLPDPTTRPHGRPRPLYGIVILGDGRGFGIVSDVLLGFKESSQRGSHEPVMTTLVVDSSQRQHLLPTASVGGVRPFGDVMLLDTKPCTDP